MNLFAAQGYRPQKADWGQAALVGAVLFILYAATSPRTVALEDDGLFVLSSRFLGVEHPPGYPLFTLFGRLFTYLPLGSVAYRVHLASACFGALTCAAAWLCARVLMAGRLPAYLAALGLGFSPVFWSQSIIAEVYTLNTFLFLLLAYLGLRACPPNGQAAAGLETSRFVPWMAFIFGLSLANHWPLMVLVAPAFAILLWPRRTEVVRRMPLLLLLAAIGLLPYAWMVLLSWSGLAISFDGPLETFAEFWYFVSRAGYAEVDTSPGADWLDRLRFFPFLGAQLAVQFAFVGTALAGIGFWQQWRTFGKRVSWFLLVAFLMPSAVLLLLLGFEYDSVSKHVFHVYPLPSYAVAALWMGLGLGWLTRVLGLSALRAAASGLVVLALIFALGSRSNMLADYDWAARYAKAVMRSLPKDAVLFVKGDVDLGPIGYFHIIEGMRPDITLYQSGGLILGNRLFHPLRTSPAEVQRILRQFIQRQAGPVAFTSEYFGGYARRERWLFAEVDKSSRDPGQVAIDVPEDALRFFEETILDSHEPNPWIAFHKDELRRRYAVLLGRSMSRAYPLDERRKTHFAALSRDFYGAIGLAEGLMMHSEGYSASLVAGLLEKAREVIPSDVPKAYRSKYFYLRGILRLDIGDKHGATTDFETAILAWPAPDNRAFAPLQDLYRAAGNDRALDALRDRVEGGKR